MKNRSESRDIIIKVLYQVYVYEGSDIHYDIRDMIRELIEVSNDFIDESIENILKNQNDIEKIANKYLKDWNINRLSKVDKAILCLGIYELMYTDTPAIVTINESIELAKKYSDDKVTKMINATLDQVYHNEGKDE